MSSDEVRKAVLDYWKSEADTDESFGDGWQPGMLFVVAPNALGLPLTSPVFVRRQDADRARASLPKPDSYRIEPNASLGLLGWYRDLPDVVMPFDGEDGFLLSLHEFHLMMLRAPDADIANMDKAAHDRYQESLTGGAS